MFKNRIEHGSYVLRTYEPKDKEYIPKVVFQVLEEYCLIPEPHGVDKDLFDIEKHYQNGFFGVVELNGTIVGTFGLSYLEKNRCEIRKMYLLVEHRGKGIGKKMLETLLALAKENACEQVELETASVLKEAVQLYLKMGFKRLDIANATIRCNQVYVLKMTS